MTRFIFIFLVDQSIVRFYPVTKKGGPTKHPLLPWHPKLDSEDTHKKLYFNIESDHGVVYRIKLRRNKHLFSKTVSSNLIGQDAGCLFSGTVVGTEQSTVGVNLCNGMVRIQPLKASNKEFYPTCMQLSIIFSLFVNAELCSALL